MSASSHQARYGAGMVLIGSGNDRGQQQALTEDMKILEEKSKIDKPHCPPGRQAAVSNAAGSGDTRLYVGTLPASVLDRRKGQPTKGLGHIIKTHIGAICQRVCVWGGATLRLGSS